MDKGEKDKAREIFHISKHLIKFCLHSVCTDLKYILAGRRKGSTF